MSSQQYTVYLPDSRTPKYFSKSLTPAEVQGALVSSGFSAVDGARMVLEGDTIRFERPTGGSKGVAA